MLCPNGQDVRLFLFPSGADVHCHIEYQEKDDGRDQDQIHGTQGDLISEEIQVTVHAVPDGFHHDRRKAQPDHLRKYAP